MIADNVAVHNRKFSSMPNALVLSSEFSDVELHIDPLSGAPVSISSGGHTMAIAGRMSIVQGGDEVRGTMGGLAYEGTELIAVGGSSPVTSRSQARLDARVYTVDAETSRPDLWSAVWHYTFTTDFPRLRVSLEVVSRDPSALARNVILDLDIDLADPAEWRIQAPGNKLRADLPLDQLRQTIAISPITGVEGSAGLLALERHDSPLTLVVWPMARETIGDPRVTPTGAGVAFSWPTDAAGQPAPDGSLRAEELLLVRIGAGRRARDTRGVRHHQSRQRAAVGAVGQSVRGPDRHLGISRRV